MRIIEKGSIVEEITCWVCKSRLEIEPTDVKSSTYKEPDGFVDTDYYIECPVCGERINLDPHEDKVVRVSLKKR